MSHHTAGHCKSREEEKVQGYFKAKAKNPLPNSTFGSVWLLPIKIILNPTYSISTPNLSNPTPIQAIVSKLIYHFPGEQCIKKHPVWAKDYGWVNHWAREWVIQRFPRPECQATVRSRCNQLSSGKLGSLAMLPMTFLLHKLILKYPKILSLELPGVSKSPRVIGNPRASAISYALNCCLLRCIFCSGYCKFPDILLSCIPFSLGINLLEILVKSYRDIWNIMHWFPATLTSINQFTNTDWRPSPMSHKLC